MTAVDPAGGLTVLRLPSVDRLEGNAKLQTSAAVA
jgi:hypothetical protein